MLDPLYSLWDGQKLGYVDARKQIYIPLYSGAVINTPAFTKLKEVFIWSAKRSDSVRTTLTEGGDFQALRAKMVPLQSETKNKINALLNDEQKKAYEAILEERRARMRNN